MLSAKLAMLFRRGCVIKKGFSLIELIIVIAVIGILAAIVLPFYRSYSQEAKAATARDHLRVLRTGIEFYAAQHGGVAPGYADNDSSTEASSEIFIKQMVSIDVSATNSENPPRVSMQKFPKNPFNDKDSVLIITIGQTFPSEPVQTDDYGWVYQPSTKEVRINWEGEDKNSVSYFDY